MQALGRIEARRVTAGRGDDAPARRGGRVRPADRFAVAAAFAVAFGIVLGAGHHSLGGLARGGGGDAVAERLADLVPGQAAP